MDIITFMGGAATRGSDPHGVEDPDLLEFEERSIGKDKFGPILKETQQHTAQHSTAQPHARTHTQDHVSYVPCVSSQRQGLDGRKVGKRAS
jgi:hypothetical protein